MAEAYTGRVAGITAFHPEARRLEIELDRPMAFRGGQYVILQAGAAKRAYSMLGGGGAGRRIEVAARRLAPGPGNRYLHGLQIGDMVELSGPWGKFHRRDADPAEAWIVATDTGITAALGVAASLPGARLHWLSSAAEPFLPLEYVRARAEESGCAYSWMELPPVDAAERPEAWRAWWGRQARRAGEVVYLSGDGALVLPARAALLAGGDVRVEAFFHHHG